MFSVHVPRARVVRLLRVILKPIPPPNKKEKKETKSKKIGDFQSTVVARLPATGFSI